MAGLMKPQMVQPFVEAIKSVTDLPIHYHGHDTSSLQASVIFNMAQVRRSQTGFVHPPLLVHTWLWTHKLLALL